MHLGLSWYFGRALRAGSKNRETELNEDWLVRIGQRKMIVCSAVAEASTDPNQPMTTAVLSDGHWLINGKKTSVSLCPAATHFYTRLKAQTQERPLQGSIMIPRLLTGVSINETWCGAGMRGSGTGVVNFSDVKMPRDSFLPRGPWGEQVSDAAGRAANSILIVAVYAGIAEAAYRYVIELLHIDGSKQTAGSSATRTAIAELEIVLSTIRGTMHLALTHLDANITFTAPRSHGQSDARNLLAECVSAGMIVERNTARALRLSADILGARSYTRHSQIERLSRDVRAATFMRPVAPADGWIDFLSGVVLDVPNRGSE